MYVFFWRRIGKMPYAYKMLCRTRRFLAIPTKTPWWCSIAGPPPDCNSPLGNRHHGCLHRLVLYRAASSPFYFSSYGVYLPTTSMARPITASHPLCEESKHLPMPSGVKGPSHKALNLSLPFQNLGHTSKTWPTSHSSVSGHIGHSALSYTPIFFR